MHPFDAQEYKFVAVLISIPSSLTDEDAIFQYQASDCMHIYNRRFD